MFIRDDYCQGTALIDSETDQYIVNSPNVFGGCPICGKNDGWRNVGRSHWFVCNRHRTKWCWGENQFSCWKQETPEDWYKNQVTLLAYVEVDPVFGLRPPTAEAAAAAAEEIIGELNAIERRRAKLPDKILPAFARVMIHLWTARKEEFENASPEQRRGHLFQDLVRLSNWINEESLTAEEACTETSEE